MKKFFLSLIVMVAWCQLFGNVQLPKIFSDNMVLQRGQQVPVWGWADHKEKIRVEFNGQVKNVVAGKDGKWRVNLEATQAGGPYQLTVKGKNTVTFNNVLVGDVWVCSGQSNMEFSVKSSKDGDKEASQANFPQIRHIEVTKSVASEPQQDIKGGAWQVCNPQNAGSFTAVGYYFAKELNTELNIPIGLIHTSWGGTHVETWTSREAFEKSEDFRSMISNMPKLNLDSVAKKNSAAAISRIEKLQGSFNNGDVDTQQWSQLTFNDEKWPVMQAPGIWEQQAAGDIDGTVWFRKTIELSAGEAGKEATLELAMIDDADETYVNGLKVGSTSSYNEPRKYKIPSGVLKAGKNLIVVRVLDTGGGGGFHGEGSAMKLSIGDGAFPLDGQWKYQVASLLTGASGVGPNSYPTLLFNAMLYPLIPFGIKGAIWYQGESNAGRAYEYRKSFPLMITDWRQQWKQGDFPFYFVQLATFNADNGDSKKGSSWAELREAQTATLALPNTGMAVTTDIGDAKDIHPTNKKDVGKRLAAVALNKTYNKKNEYSGPVFDKMEIKEDKAILSFTHIGAGLATNNKYGYLKGFEIAGADQQFHYARAFIEGDKIVVSHDGIDKPVAVRFGWADDTGDNNLFNKEGFPAVPFRTDSWKGITENNKFEISK